MFGLPSARDVAAVAEGLGIHLDDEDAAAYRDFVVEQLAAFDDFLQARLDEDRPPLLFPSRAPGHRPTSAEDPHNAWVWRCSIGGAEEGILAGRTVSFKDHIAVAGLPLAFGTSVLDGNIADADATVVTRVLAAGGEVVGKNAHHGFSGLLGLGGRVGDHGEPRNPRAPDRITGGSSSGGAAAVAAGEVDIAFGGDQGGSVRHPAAYCGVGGREPTEGRGAPPPPPHPRRGRAVKWLNG